MVTIIACTCPEGEGLPHSHVGRRFIYRMPNGQEVRLDESTQKLNIALVQEWDLLREEPPAIKVWINWKDVAKAVMT